MKAQNWLLKGLIFWVLLFPARFPLYPQEGAGDGAEWEDSGPDADDDYWDFGETGQNLTVTGKRDTPVQEKIISREEIERIAAPDIPTLLEEALDMPITRHGAYGNSTDVNMRGFNTERIAILIDGVPVNSAMSGEFDFNTLNMNNIERIEVIYGGSDSKFNVSGALGGVINIVTIKKRAPGLHFGFGVQNISYMPGGYSEWDSTSMPPQWQDLADTQKLDFSLSHGSENFSFGLNLFGNRAENHYLFIDSFLYRLRRKQFNEIWDVGGGTIFTWNLPNLAKLIANADLYYSDKNIPANGFASVLGKQHDLNLRDSLVFEAPVFLREDLSAEATISHNFGRLTYEKSRHDQQSFSLINRWAWYPHKKLVFRAGWDYRYIFLDSTEVGVQDRHDGGAYLTIEGSPVSSLTVIPSLKMVSNGKDTVPVPKLGFLWKPVPFLDVKNNWFRSFKFPDFMDLYWSGFGFQGNEALRPEDGWGADLGADFRFRDLFSAESSVFAQYTLDSIHWHRAVGGYWEPENIGEAALFGADLRLKSAFPVSWGPIIKISPAASYQYLLTYLLSYGWSWEHEQRIPYQPMHTIGVSLDTAWATGSVLFSAHYESTRYYSISNLIELDPYLLLTVNVNQQIGKYFKVFTVFRNLLNQSYESYNRYPMPGFSLTLGMRFNM
jgi:vitamin B12 transporter